MSGFSAAAVDATPIAELKRRASLKWSVPPAGGIGAFIAEMDLGVADCVAESIRRSLADGAFGYPSPALEAEFGVACADWQRRYFGFDVDPANVHVLADVLKVLDLTIEYFTAPGSPVILPTPAYMPFFALPPTRGREIIEVPSHVEDGCYTMDLDGIDRAFAAGAGLLVLCNPHNPVGRVYTRAELEAVCEVVDAHGGRVFADEIHAPLLHPGTPGHVPYASISPVAAGHTITGTSMSKAFNLPGLKAAAAIVTNEADAAVWSGFHLVVTHGAATPGIAANIAAYRDGDAWLADARTYLTANRDHLAALVAERLPEVRFRPPEGTYLAWLDLRALDLPTTPGVFLRERAGVWTNDGVEFGEPGRGFVRLNMATPKPVLTEIVERIAAATG